MKSQGGRIGSIELIKEKLGIADNKIITAKVIYEEEDKMEYKTKQQLADEMVEAWEKFWKASEEFENSLVDFGGSNILDISNQRILQMKSKLYADRCDIEFSLNRLIEDEQVNGR